MAESDWTIRHGFPEPLRWQAAQLYFDAFSGKLGSLLGHDGRGVALFDRILDPRYAISAVSSDGTALLGIAGYKTREGALTGGGLSDLASVYGWIGALWRAPLLAMLERETASGQLLMDGIAVAPTARGTGIGSALLGAIVDEAADRGLNEVRLDVIDSNPRARALYERLGFVAQSIESTGPLRYVFGFDNATIMVLRIARPIGKGMPK